MPDTEWQFNLIWELRRRLMLAIQRCGCRDRHPELCEQCEADLKWLEENV